MQTKPHPIRAIRRAGVPLVFYETADPAQCITAIARSLNGGSDKIAVLAHDCVSGLRGLNDKGVSAAAEMFDDPKLGTSPVEALIAIAEKLPSDSIVFMHNLQLFMENDGVKQALWNCRDALKVRQSTLIGLGPGVTLPPELKQDVMIVSEPLPTPAELDGIVDGVIESAVKGAGFDKDQAAKFNENRENVIDSLLGLSAFCAEQTLALSITKEGIDRAGLWERKRRMIEQTRGLTVYRGKETFADMGGCDNAKLFLSAVLKGKKAPRAILWIDEIEKAMAGAGTTGGDTSGVSQDFHGQMLQFMQETESPGLVEIGPPGCSKSLMPKCAGNEANIPVIALDVGGMKSSFVGSSEQSFRQAFKIANAISQGQLLVIATCNSIGVISPELKRRFTLGIMYFDLPTAQEQSKIWPIHLRKYEIPSQPLPECENWTGAEIKQCCELAWRLNWTLEEAAKFIVPVYKSAAETIDRLRDSASGKYISASAPGLYRKPTKATATRKVEL